MKKLLSFVLLNATAVTSGLYAQTSLTIYNGNFAVIRNSLELDLKEGINNVTYNDISYQLEPESVILRDKAGKQSLNILEQSYRNDPVSEGLLLKQFEGKELTFQTTEKDTPILITGKVIRSGYVMGRNWYNGSEAIIQTEKGIQFGLPGQVLFPNLGNDGNILKPELRWKLQSDTTAKVNAEIGYISYGLSWKADYNITLPEKSDTGSVSAWITMSNTSGRAYENATVSFIAGDVNKQRQRLQYDENDYSKSEIMYAPMAARLAVTQKAFDEFHYYNLPNAITLLNNETKQIEFIRADGVKVNTVYEVNSASSDSRNQNEEKRIETVSILRKINNKEENHLGMPFPGGNIRLYRENGTQLEFVGESNINHTPKNEEIKFYTGKAFDLIAESRIKEFASDSTTSSSLIKVKSQPWIQETIEFTLKNRKNEAATVELRENLRSNRKAQIKSSTVPYESVNASQILMKVDLKPDEEKTVEYIVYYTW